MIGGRRSYMQVAGRIAAATPEARERVGREVRASLTWESLAESSRQRRSRTRKELQVYYEVDNPGQDLFKLTPEQYTEELQRWLSFKIMFSEPTKKRFEEGATLVAARTLTCWRMDAIRVTEKYYPDGRKLVRTTLLDDLYRHCGYLTMKHSLQLLAEPKNYCGKEEVRLMTEAIYCTATDVEWAIQLDLMLKLLFTCGYRPGALGPSDKDLKARGRHLKWKDVTIRLDGLVSFIGKFEVSALKCFNGIRAKRITHQIRQPQLPENVVFDAMLPAAVLAVIRGGVKGVKTVQDLMKYKGTRLVWEDNFADQPVILAGSQGGKCVPGVPMMARNIAAQISGVAHKIQADISAYDFRRNYGDCLDERMGAQEASIGLGQTDVKTYREFYDRGAANYDHTGVVTGETLHGRADLNSLDRVSIRKDVGLSDAIADRLVELRDTGNTAAPRRLKRKYDPIVKPSVVPTRNDSAVDEITDDQCREHAAWRDFTQLPTFVARTEELARLKAIMEEGLALLDNESDRVPSRLDELSDKRYHNAYLRHLPIHNVHTATIRRKMRRIRESLAGVGQNDDLDTEHTHESLQERRNQLAEPSMLVEAAMQRAPAFKRIRLDPVLDIEDPDFQPLDEGIDTTATIPEEYTLEEVPIEAIRMGYITMMTSCAKPRRLCCPDCQADPTASKKDKLRIWTPFQLTRHIASFHTLKKQIWRWFQLDGGCYLCALDHEPETFSSEASFRRHVHFRNGAHAGDPRLPDLEKPEIALPLPEGSLSDEQVEMADAYGDSIVARFVPPPEAISEEEMVAMVADLTMDIVDLDDFPGELDVRAIERAYDKLPRTLRELGFHYVVVPP